MRLNLLMQSWLWRAACICCLFIWVCGSVGRAQQASDSVASTSDTQWYGVMDAGDRVFRFSIEPSSKVDSVDAYELVSYDEGEQRFALSNFTCDGSQMTFELKRTKATYSATSTDGNQYQGSWKQSGLSFPLTFRKKSAITIEKPDEIWVGEMGSVFQKLKMQFRVFLREGGPDRVLVDSVTQGAGGFKATRKIDGDEWSVDVPILKSSFTGKLSSDKGSIVGKWTQGGQSLDLVLKKTEQVSNTVVIAPRRPQTPKEPFSYQSEEVVIENTKDNVDLAATLTVPSGTGPFPAVVLVSGSGPQDRNESILEHKPFWVIADYLTRNGIAVLRYDDRGTGASSGDFTKGTTEDFANDAEAAVDYLRKKQAIAPELVGMIGHSEGGSIVSMVAARRKDVAFIVMLAGPGVSGREIVLSQGQLIVKASGVNDEASLTGQRKVQETLISLALSSESKKEFASSVESAIEKLKTDLGSSQLIGVDVSDSVKQGLKQLRTPWFQYFLQYEPGPVLEKVQCPVLVLNGEKDVQVDPKLNLPAIQKALEVSGNKSFVIRELPSLNHLFQNCKTGGVEEYQSIEETFSPAALEEICKWIQQVVKP